jgi:hypothetical protein
MEPELEPLPAAWGAGVRLPKDIGSNVLVVGAGPLVPLLSNIPGTGVFIPLPLSPNMLSTGDEVGGGGAGDVATGAGAGCAGATGWGTVTACWGAGTLGTVMAALHCGHSTASPANLSLML